MIGRRLVAVLLCAVSAVGCATGPAPTVTPTPRATLPPPSASPDPFTAGHYADGMLAFDFPPDWHAERSWYPSSVSDLKGYFSTEELRPPCIQSGTAILCRKPVAELSPGGLLISWWRWGLHHGAPGPDPTAGQLIHVGGRSARLHDARAEGHCLDTKADQTLRLEIPDPTLDGSWTVMDACLREPVEDSRAKMDAMLASVEWSAPQPTELLPLGDPPAVTVALFDDTGLVTNATFEVRGAGDQAGVFATDTGVVVSWAGPFCGQEPIIGLARDSGKLLVLLEPFAGLAAEPGMECDVFSPLLVTLALSEPVAQNDLHLEVW